MYHNLRNIQKDKKAAIELSIGTVVIIVLAMSMLILGIVLIRNIFAGASDSVNSLNDKVKGEIAKLFTEKDEKIVIFGVGSDRTIKIKQGTEGFGIAISSRVDKPSVANPNEKLKFKLKLKQLGQGSCDPNTFKDYFLDYDPTSDWSCSGAGSSASCETRNAKEFEDFDNPIGYQLLSLNIPKDADTCTQKVQLEVDDTSGPTGTTTTKSFSIKVVSGGIFS